MIARLFPPCGGMAIETRGRPRTLHQYPSDNRMFAKWVLRTRDNAGPVPDSEGILIASNMNLYGFHRQEIKENMYPGQGTFEEWDITATGPGRGQASAPMFRLQRGNKVRMGHQNAIRSATELNKNGRGQQIKHVGCPAKKDPFSNIIGTAAQI
ncbi:hypothetical protein BJ165DRAFT_1404687 [Panaeolus papilionaceus]|nr:hypothetical protein BJ165DRAFT_1404687 [Panaeolus papilionaceus]